MKDNKKGQELVDKVKYFMKNKQDKTIPEFYKDNTDKYVSEKEVKRISRIAYRIAEMEKCGNNYGIEQIFYVCETHSISTATEIIKQIPIKDNGKSQSLKEICEQLKSDGGGINEEGTVGMIKSAIDTFKIAVISSGIANHKVHMDKRSLDDIIEFLTDLRDNYII